MAVELSTWIILATKVCESGAFFHQEGRSWTGVQSRNIGICELEGNSVDAIQCKSDKLETNCDPPGSGAFQGWPKMRVAQETWVWGLALHQN